MGYVEQIAPLIQRFSASYNIKVVSPIIAQFVLESASGTSELAVNANNHAGLKYRDNRCPSACGYYYKVGSEQDQVTKEYTSSNMKWFKFPSLEACVQGYFDFTSIAAYAKAREASTPEAYLQGMKDAFYASSVDYVSKCMNVIKKYNLTQYDPVIKEETKKILYRVQVGAYSKKENAEAMCEKLKKDGFSCFIKEY